MITISVVAGVVIARICRSTSLNGVSYKVVHSFARAGEQAFIRICQTQAKWRRSFSSFPRHVNKHLHVDCAGRLEEREIFCDYL